jgi:hypothetical protein
MTLARWSRHAFSCYVGPMEQGGCSWDMLFLCTNCCCPTMPSGMTALPRRAGGGAAGQGTDAHRPAGSSVLRLGSGASALSILTLCGCTKRLVGCINTFDLQWEHCAHLHWCARPQPELWLQRLRLQVCGQCGCAGRLTARCKHLPPRVLKLRLQRKVAVAAVRGPVIRSKSAPLPRRLRSMALDLVI